MTYARKVDQTHGPIKRVLERAGWDVLDTHAAANFVDLIANKAGRIVLIECKTGKGRYTKGQRDLIARGWPIVTLRSEAEAIAFVETR